MKTIVKEYNISERNLELKIGLQSLLREQDGSTTTTGDVPASVLDSLQVEMTQPKQIGEQVLTTDGDKPNYYEINDAELIVYANKMPSGTNVITLKVRYGTQVFVAFQAFVNVAENAEDDGVEISEDVVVYEGIGDGAGSVLPEVYQVLTDEDENKLAHIAKPLTISGSVQEGNPYGKDIYELNVAVLTPEQKAEVEDATGTAYEYCDTNDGIPDGVNVTIYADEECTQKVGSTVKTEYAETPIEGDFFNLQDGESISAGTYYARLERGTLGENSHAEGSATTASGENSHAEGNATTASGNFSHAEGSATTASGYSSHAEGSGTTASGENSHAEGNATTASGNFSHAEGSATIASGNFSHAEGSGTTASEENSHAEGNETTASGYSSHAEGSGTTASGYSSHAEGNGTIASGYSSHAEGSATTASGNFSHAEGSATTASGYSSHAEGNGTIASGNFSHAEGNETIASHANQHVSGKFNVEDTNGDYALIVGNGADDSARSNAFAIDWNGNLVLFNNGTPVILTPAKLAQLVA